MRSVRPGLPTACVIAIGFSWPSASTAQEIRAVGGVLGRVSSQQIWTPRVDTDPRRGWAAGAFVDVALPPSALSIVAEAALVQRGTSLTVDAGGGAGATEVRSDYVAFPLLLKLRYFRAPVGLFAFLGPVMETLLSTQADPGLAQVYASERSSVWSGAFGGGAEALIRSRAVVVAEVRFVEGFSNAYDGDVAKVRHRSVEVLVRFGLRPRTETPPR